MFETSMHKRKRNDIFYLILDFLLMVPKLPVFMVLFLLSFCYVSISAIIPIRKIRTVAFPKVYTLIFRALLFLTGLYEISEQLTPLVDRYSEVAEDNHPKTGDIIITNCSSYLNLFWLQYKFNPIFVFPVSRSDVVAKGFFNLLFSILKCKPLTNGPRKNLNELIEISKKENRVLVLFPEASVTDGEHIFKFHNFGDGINLDDTNFHIYGFVHYDSRISPNFVKGNGFVHILLMIGRMIAGLKVKIALKQDIPKAINNKIDDKWICESRKILSVITGLPLIEIDVKDLNLLHLNKKRIE